MKMRFSTSLFVLFFSFTTEAAIISRAYFQLAFRDFMDYGICETQSCDLETLLAAGQTLEEDLRSAGARTDFTAVAFCNCQGQARPLENLMTSQKAQLVRSVSRAMARVVAGKNPSNFRLFSADLLKATKPLYEQFMGRQNFARLHAQLTSAMRTATSFSSFGSQNYLPLITQGFAVGNILNAPRNIGCRESTGFSCVTPEDIETVRRYTGNEYNAFNEVAALGASHNPYLDPYVERLKNLIQKLKPARTISFRGTTPDERLVNLRVGGPPLTENIFMSSSLNSRIAQNFLVGAVQIFFTKNCPVISGAGAVFKGELEVICNPGTQFRLVHREYRGGNLYLFLEEI